MGASSSANAGATSDGCGYDALWAEAAKRIGHADLAGLRVRCPSCHRTGALVSKWQAKTPVKPLFIVHTNGNGHFKPCKLDKQEAESARHKAHLTPGDVIRTFALGKPYVLFSGGKDSVATLLYLQRLAEKHHVKLTALHADTTAGFPEVEDYVREVCTVLDVSLVTVRPQRDYFETAKRWGIPGFRSRWCCETLKIAPIRRFLAQQKGHCVVYDGIRAAESNLRAKYVPVWFHPSFRCISISPILRWSHQDTLDYVASAGLPRNPTEDLGTSGECWCGAYKSRCDFEALLNVHPEIFDKLVEVEEAQEGDFTFLYENGQSVPLSTLRTR
ncbi:phosphoadenosine phosphosulfate reductase family protein [bacterium]|nr:phosphoadenosine phosphosulfate reductase family protein [bacterium]